MERYIVSTLPRVARAVTGLGEVGGVQRLSVVVWSMGCRRETEEDILLFRGGTSVTLSSTRTRCKD